MSLVKFEDTWTGNWKNAIRGMRAPMNSWAKTDSVFNKEHNVVLFGTADNILAKSLIKAGPEHRKFMRLIHISCFITIPRAIWQELDTYKVSTVRMSCSTMHKLGSRALTPEDFQDLFVLGETLQALNDLGEKYRKDKRLDVLRKMKLILPEGFMQSAVYDMSYETAFNMYHQRRTHRMEEWSKPDGICEWIQNLPMMNQWLHCREEVSA